MKKLQRYHEKITSNADYFSYSTMIGYKKIKSVDTYILI